MTTGSERLDNSGKQASEAEYARTPAAEEQAVRAARPVADSHPSASEKEHRRAERFRWKLTGAMSVIATGATLAAAWFAAGAYKAGWQAVVEAHRQVEAVKEANEISRRTLAAAIGASVHFGRVEFRQFTAAQGVNNVNIRMAIGNDGGTTTRGLVYSAACTVSSALAPDPFDCSTLDKSPVYSLTLAAKGTVQHVICFYSFNQWARMVAMQGTVSVYGRAVYRDTINPEQVHRLEFYTQLADASFNAGPFNPGPYALGTECKDHNCSDEDCGPDQGAHRTLRQRTPP